VCSSDLFLWSVSVIKMVRNNCLTPNHILIVRDLLNLSQQSLPFSGPWMKNSLLYSPEINKDLEGSNRHVL